MSNLIPGNHKYLTLDETSVDLLYVWEYVSYRRW